MIFSAPHGDSHPKRLIAEADESTARARLNQREGCHAAFSDAHSEEHAMSNNAFEPPDELPADGKLAIPTHNAVDRVTRQLLTTLATDPQRNRH